MIVITNNFKFRKWFKYGLKSKHPTAARPERAEAPAHDCYRHKQHALKGQKLPAQDCYGHKQHALKGQKLPAQDCYGHKQHALKGAEAHSPGQRPGYNDNQQCAL